MVVAHVVDMPEEVAKSVVEEYKFTMEVVPLLVGFSLEKLLPEQQQL